MANPEQVLLSLFIVFVSAQVGSEIAQRLKLPSVVGQIAAGIAIGPSALAWISPNQPLEVLAEIGAILLLFSVGLETRLAELRRVGKIALFVGVFGVIVPFVIGGAWALAASFPLHKAAFVAAAFVATSAGITARVLQELGALDRIESKIILGAAIIDDVLAMLLLGVVAGLQTQSGIDVMHLLLVLAQAVAFVALVAVLGTKIMKRSSKLMEAPMDAESPLSISLAVCLGLAAAAAYSGLAAIIGAFLAGMILAETQHREDLEQNTRPLMALLLPFFFVLTGSHVDLALLGSWPVIGTVLFVTFLAVISKLIGCGFAARSMGRRSALTIGVGMVPRGEVGIIIASLGKQAGVFGAGTYAIVIAMSLLTSVIAPPALKLLLRPAGGEEKSAEAT
ncbi:MAG: cation:proton antiporter [Armatimonadota bacterium]|nr:cation:proton antiporter [Armatimonadota bacterium]